MGGDSPVNSVTQSSGLIQLRVKSRTAVLKGVKSTVYVVFEIVTGEKKDKDRRPPFNLALVLDRSGSMSGPPLQNSKTACKKVVESMKASDLLHFVTYDDSVQVVFEGMQVKNKQHIKGLIDAVTDGGSTNLMGGVEEGFECLRRHDEVKNKRVFLFSDGQANHGITAKDEICKHINEMHTNGGANFTSFGIGASFDEKLMMGIAEHGRGDYLFIEGAHDIEKKVMQGMSVLLELLGKNSTLKVRGKNNAHVVKMHGYPDVVKGAVIGDIAEDDVRTVLVEVEITPDASKDGDDMIAYLFEFEEPEGGKVVSLEGVLPIAFTENDTHEGLGDPPAVEVALVIAQASELDNQALALVQNGKMDEAIGLKERVVKEYKRVLEYDEGGLVELLLKQAEKTLASMKEEKDQRLVEKAIHHEGYHGHIVHRKCF